MIFLEHQRQSAIGKACLQHLDVGMSSCTMKNISAILQRNWISPSSESEEEYFILEMDRAIIELYHPSDNVNPPLPHRRIQWKRALLLSSQYLKERQQMSHVNTTISLGTDRGEKLAHIQMIFLGSNKKGSCSSLHSE